MASIGTLFPTTSSAAAGSATSSQTSPGSPSTSGADSLANQNTFLTLLVAQLKNQDPTQPMDGTTFVTQLAQFSSLTENLASRQDLDGISKQYLGLIPSDAASASAGTSSSSTVSGG
jgi:flagellar basal-body rod modification protein FlgD